MPNQPLRYPPPGGFPYPIHHEEDWGSVAKRWQVDPRALIYFNFHTNNTDEVNWYLSHKVGCNQPTHDGFNWIFSPSATPGVIYIPLKKTINMEGETITPEPEGFNQLARFLDGLDDLESPTLMWIEHIIDVVDLIHVAVGVAEVEGFLATGLELTAPALAEIGAILAISNAYDEGIAYIKKDWFLRGFSYGVLLGANGAGNNYIKANFELRPEAFTDAKHPEEKHNFRNAYHAGVISGVRYGRQLNRAERAKLFRILLDQEGRWSQEELRNWNNWSDAARKDYYIRLGAQFRRHFLPQL
jgi:hypothetical protein